MRTNDHSEHKYETYKAKPHPEDYDVHEFKSWPTKTEMTVMRILVNDPAGLYGLQIVEGSNGEVKRGSVYVLLGRLEEKGYVRSAPSKVAENYPGLPRPVYKLTAPGRQVLEAAEQLGMKGAFA